MGISARVFVQINGKVPIVGFIFTSFFSLSQSYFSLMVEISFVELKFKEEDAYEREVKRKRQIPGLNTYLTCCKT